MFRLFGIITGAVLVGGGTFFHLKSSQEEHHIPLPTISALSNQWQDCRENQQSEPCQAFQADPAHIKAADRAAPMAPSFDDVAEKVAPKIEKAIAKATEITETPQTQPAEPDASVSAQPEQNPADAITDEVTPVESEYFELESVSGAYEADQLFAIVDDEETFLSTQWQVFWSPFQSEIAAKGFAAQIAKISGVAIQVIKQNTLQYMVAYPYTTPEERIRHAETIEKAFGMSIRNQGDWS